MGQVQRAEICPLVFFCILGFRFFCLCVCVCVCVCVCFVIPLDVWDLFPYQGLNLCCCLGAWSLNDWINREVPISQFLMDGSPTLLLSSKEPTYNAGAMGSVLGSGRSVGEGNAKPLQFSCPGKMPWTAHGVTKESGTT